MALSVHEAANTYVSAMRNMAPAGPGVCTTCHTFVDLPWSQCYACGHSWASADVVVPITYSEHLGQIHTVLRKYKDGSPAGQVHLMNRLAAVLWLFLHGHGRCVGRAGGAAGDFDVVTVVPSGQFARDAARGNLRTVVGKACVATAPFEILLKPTGQVQGRLVSPDRYTATRRLSGLDVLLVDDTWTTGASAQSAAWSLKQAGASTVSVVIIGRHLNPDWEVQGTTSGALLAGLPKRFDWTSCAVHP